MQQIFLEKSFKETQNLPLEVIFLNSQFFKLY